jgi:hypothetical protein
VPHVQHARAQSVNVKGKYACGATSTAAPLLSVLCMGRDPAWIPGQNTADATGSCKWPHAAALQLAPPGPFGVCMMAALHWAALVLLASTSLAFNPSDFRLPPGFQISVYRADLPNARSLARSQANRKSEIVYVSTNSANRVTFPS